MSDERIDLAYIGRVLQRLSHEVASLLDHVQVLIAIVHRVDNGRTRLLTEIRPTPVQISEQRS